MNSGNVGISSSLTFSFIMTADRNSREVTGVTCRCTHGGRGSHMSVVGGTGIVGAASNGFLGVYGGVNGRCPRVAASR